MTSCRIKNLQIARFRGVLLAGWLWLAGIGMVQAQQPLDTLKFPAAVKITREGREPVPHASPVFAFEDLSEGNEHAVFPGPPCLEGSYYVGFQLYYDLLGHRNTTILWSDYLEVSLLHGEDTLWRQPLRLDMQSQTFLATIFHDKPITCDGDYRFFINRNDSTGVVPVDYINLRVLLYKRDQDVFSPALAIDLDYCQSSSTDHVTVDWSYPGAAWLEYDLEWVFIEEHESTNTMTPQQAFQFKQPARITTAASHWDHLAYYPKGRIWYRVRAVGYNPQYPGHRIPGAWSYSACGARAVENHEPDKTWQKQVVFAEEGKSKTIMQYFDGTLRQRQSLTNLNQEKVTVVAESLYDFEGRRSSDIMAVPTVDASLNYHEAFNTFQTQDPVVAANTGTGRSKFHYDNYRLTNSVLSNTSGAANYYSPQSQDSTIHQAFIPDAEGYVYSQTEYLRDGTGRVSRQSGVGKEFRMDGQHITRYYYAEPNREELIRLFGTNVGDVSHYKKNLVVDPNGQVSVSYQDQEDRVIATALAGDAPLNVEHLPAYDSLPNDSITVRVLDRNRMVGSVSETVSKFTNVSPSRYTFRYNLSALGSEMGVLGCQTCRFDLALTLTDPEGMRVNLSAFAGNGSPVEQQDGVYRRLGISAACEDTTKLDEVVLSVWMAEIGEYTLTKTLTARELSYEELKTIVSQDTTFQQQAAALQQYYQSDPADCVLCDAACPGADELIDEAVGEVSNLDCDNILHQIQSELREKHAREHPEVDTVYVPTEAEIGAHALYCKYELCTRNVASDIFDRNMVRHQSWEAAQAAYTSSVLDGDPFFNDPALSGTTRKGEMASKLADVIIGTVPYDNNGDGSPDGQKVYHGNLSDVVNPENADFKVDANGKPDDNGLHILYMDLMTRRGTMSPEAYTQELSRQRWTMYRAFYTEAKRQIKLVAYQSCPAALEDLQAGDELLELNTEEEVTAWAERNQALGYDSVSQIQLDATINSIRNACGTEFSAPDRAAMAGHLKTYFESNNKNYLRLILANDVGSNTSLQAVQQILDGYGCKLDSSALINPLLCLESKTVFYSTKRLSGITLGRIQMTESKDGSLLETSRLKSREAWEKMLLELSTQRLTSTNSTTATQRLARSSAVIAMAAKMPSEAEWNALWAFYDATGGPNWTYQTGWSTANRSERQDVTGWYGLQTNNLGNVTGIDMYSNFAWSQNCNNLSGTIPQEINDLHYLETLNLTCNNLSGAIPSLTGLTSLLDLRLRKNQFTGSIPSSLSVLVQLETLDLSENGFSGSIPSSLASLTNLKGLNLADNNLIGSIPSFLGTLEYLEGLFLGSNNLSGSIPDELGALANLENLSLGYNQIEGNFPATFSQLLMLNSIEVSNNKMSGVIPSGIFLNKMTGQFNISYNDFSGDLRLAFGETGLPYWLEAQGNKYTFSTLVGVLKLICDWGEASYVINDQGSVDTHKVFTLQDGGTLTLEATVDRNLQYGSPSKYQWFRNGVPLAETPQPDAAYHTVVLQNVSMNDVGEYYYEITNAEWPMNCNNYGPDLVLRSLPQSVSIQDSTKRYYEICLQYDTANATLALFKFKIDWNKRLLDCIKNAHSEDSLVLSYATNRLLETYVGRFNQTYTTKCFKNTLENLAYTYTPREYHYTLYYYDQSANLVQTVPPTGVRPLNHDQVLQFVDQSDNPPHKLVTRYRYNSINQLVWQSTPDAGESNFWYNNLGQLRLSQNAQQYKDTLYSYSRYDEQGRIVEVGEMATADSLKTLVAGIDSLLFPQAKSYTLTDITRTHYDFAFPGSPADFEQQHLRTRVSWVEVLEKYQTDTISTTYSYDVHGNVKSLLQNISGLSPKRTDYVYDLVSGKVNYVLYQFAQSDQFIHRYGYDDDNRITDVHTSSDGFIWDHDARYYYYKHGPLARTELGEYRVQGLDYYYTLQGWIKGVNLPYQDNPVVGNVLDGGVGKDVFSYALGYYQGDYMPVAPGLVPPETRDKLWTRQQEMHGHTGIYNGNISWMITDLAKLGEVAGNRAKGMQAMLYKYDQLHRLVKSRSLTNYAPTTGFAGPTGAYDEDYTYDSNGNILTLLRHKETGAVADDFHYQYYANTNKLREVKPVTKDKVYSSGQIRTDNIVYRNVTINGTAHVPAGSTVEVKALNDILMDPDFQAHEESDFWAHILPDEGTYQYDAIGNLILDQDEGVKIRWTPYGKVRDVHTRGDSIVVTFRYDASGNRIEKKVVKRDTVTSVKITRYVLDASGNVMTLYNDTTLTDQPIYGSSRIGQYTGDQTVGYRVLGNRLFELSNHLGSVLAIVTDHARAENDSMWTVVLNTSDYYPFGLEMGGRVFSDSTDRYRFGFNGKEADNEPFNNEAIYDYGERVYSPLIGRFLSSDPLKFTYAMLSPYQYASNMPVLAKDLDGLEAAMDPYGTQQFYLFKSFKDAGYTQDQALTLAKKVTDDQAKAGTAGVLTGAAVATGYGVVVEYGATAIGAIGMGIQRYGTQTLLTLQKWGGDIANFFYGVATDDPTEPFPSTGMQTSDAGVAAKRVIQTAINGLELSTDGKVLEGLLKLSDDSGVLFDANIIEDGTNLTLDKIGFYMYKGSDILGAENKGSLGALPLKILTEVKKYVKEKGFKTLTLKYKRALYDETGNMTGYGEDMSQTIKID